MSNKIPIAIILLISISFCYISSAQPSNTNENRVRLLYERLEFDEAIETGQNLLASNLELGKEDLITINEYMALSFYNLGKIDSARSHFLSLLSIEPAFELDPIEVSPKIITFFNELKQEAGSQQAEDAIGYTKYIFVEDLRPGATFRSIILPGWGQFYKHQKTRGYILGGAFVASLAATGVSLYFEKDNRDKYLGSTTPSTIEKDYQTYNDWFKRRKLFTVSTICIWAVAVLDAMWTPYPQVGISLHNKNLSLSLNIPLRK